MEKLVFKNMYLNAVFGGILVVIALLGYFLDYLVDNLPIFIAVVLILLSLKRFIFSFKKITSKYATLILIVEFILDIVFAGLLIYLGDHIGLFIGLIIYIRGVSYLLINYIATRKINLLQYVFNIGYVTLGAFFMFTGLDLKEGLALGLSVLILLVGLVYLQHGLVAIVKKEERVEEENQEIKSQIKQLKAEKKEVAKIVDQQDKIEQLKKEVKQVEEQKKSVVKENKELQKKVVKTEEPKKQELTIGQLESKTVAELKVIAKEKNLQGYSQLKKSELIALIQKG